MNFKEFIVDSENEEISEGAYGCSNSVSSNLEQAEDYIYCSIKHSDGFKGSKMLDRKLSKIRNLISELRYEVSSGRHQRMPK